MKRKLIDEINRSAPTLGHFNTGTMNGFAARLLKQYGPYAVIKALPHTKLTPLESAWIYRKATKAKEFETEGRPV